MKKILLSLLIVSITSVAQSATCANGAGKAFLGNDGKTYYCESNVRMNWWSAFTWCKSIDGELVDINSECLKPGKQIKSCGSGECPCFQFTGNIPGYTAWTRNVLANNKAFLIQIWGIGNQQKSSTSSAVCTMPDGWEPEEE